MTLKLTPFINLKRNAREAIQFYEKAIDAKVLTMITYGDMPEMPNTYRDDLKDFVALARLQTIFYPGFWNVKDKFSVTFRVYTEI